MSSQNNWNTPDMYYQQPQSGSAANGSVGAENYSNYGASTGQGGYPGGGGYPVAGYGGSHGATGYGSSYSAASYGSAGPGFQPLPPNNTLAIIALVASIGGVLAVPILGSIAGIVMGHIARRQIRDRGERGDGMAVAALWVGYVGLALVVLFIVAYVLFIVLFVGGAIYMDGVS